MRIALFLSTFGGSPLQGGIERGLIELGHEVCIYRPGSTYDLIIVFNQVSHRFDYRYPDFPPKEIPIAFVDCAEYGYFTRLPDRARQFATAFTHASIHHDTKNKYEQMRLKEWIEGRNFPYFLREYSKYVDFPAAYHPIDYPLYHLSDCTQHPDEFEYVRRQLELYCSWGLSHPWRLNLTEELRGAHRKSEIGIIEMDGHPRHPQEFYFGRMRAAKVCPSFDGYGSGAFRMTEALVRTLLLMAPLSVVTREPLVDGYHCRMYEVQHDGETFISSNIVEVMNDALANPEKSFEIYRNGYYHCRDKYSERATAAYLLSVVEAHDYSRHTDLTI